MPKDLELELFGDLARTLSREKFATAAAAAFIANSSRELLQEVAVKGFDEFLIHARPVYSGHGFRHEDYRAIFRNLELAAQGKVTVRSLLTVALH